MLNMENTQISVQNNFLQENSFSGYRKLTIQVKLLLWLNQICRQNWNSFEKSTRKKNQS